MPSTTSIALLQRLRVRSKTIWLIGCAAVIAIPALAVLLIAAYFLTIYSRERVFRETYAWQEREGGRAEPINVPEGRIFTNIILDGTEFTDEQAAELVLRMPQLKELRLNGTLVTDRGLRHIDKLRKLETLEVAGTQITPRALTQFRAQHPNIEIWHDQPKQINWTLEGLNLTTRLGGTCSAWGKENAIILDGCKITGKELQIVTQVSFQPRRLSFRNSNIADSSLQTVQVNRLKLERISKPS